MSDAAPKFQRGWTAGYSDYRYGAKRSVTLPPVGTMPHAPVFTGHKRQAVIDRVMTVMRDWRDTPFQKEAAVRHGLRQGLCLEGYAWLRADIAAEDIVAHCFRLMGAKRPTWEQGQREYVTPREQCSWCQGEIDAGLLGGEHRIGFCSDVCARAALDRRDRANMRGYDHAVQAARLIIRRVKNGRRSCEWCQKSFFPVNRVNSNRFCSYACTRSSSRLRQERSCAGCGKAFTPRQDHKVKYCSQACARKHYARPAICLWCAKPFLANSPAAASCSKACTNRRLKFASGAWKPKVISPPVFDAIFKMAA